MNYPDHFLKSYLYLVLFIVVILNPLLSVSQVPDTLRKKLSPVFQIEQRVAATQGESLFVIAVSSNDQFAAFLEETPSITAIYRYPGAAIFLVRAGWKDLYEKLLPRGEVLFVDQQRVPREEVAVSNLDLSTNKANTLHNRFPQYNGNGLGVSVKEHRPDTLDIDLKGRYFATPYTSATLSSHATIMATIIAGAGNTYYEGRGVADAANINSVSFATLLPEPELFYQQFNVSVQNHSYGTGIENFYGADASAYDASVITRPSLLHVFSAGNSGTAASPTGIYTGITGYANITGSFKMAKNLLTVGHTDSFGLVLPPSSRGPAYDGRLKPELVAFGEDGSSGAAAIVSGIATTLQHAYKELNGVLPSSALTRALILNSTDEAATPGIDYQSGYGSANAVKAMQGLVNNYYFTGSVSTGGTNLHQLQVPASIKKVKITLVWNDPPAAANAPKALINDLDLQLELIATGQAWLPWVLSSFPHPDSLAKLPQRKKDDLNTAEQVTLDNPVPGMYAITVRGFNVPVSSPQSYSVAYQFDTLDRFTWNYPTARDNIFSGSVNTIRWESTFSTGAGQLEYSIDNGSSWQLINNAVDLTKGYYKWIAPDTFVTSLLRMNVNAQPFPSELFTISKRFNVYVGFDCPDSFSFYWNRIKGVNSYQVYHLGAKYMEPLLLTNDTSVVLSKATHPSLYYAVAPLLGPRQGVRSYGFNYTTQGTGCYIRTFFGSLSGNAGLLELELGTVYGISSISWEKRNPGGFVSLGTITSLAGLTHSFMDNDLFTGLNVYRVKITLTNGLIIYSDEVIIVYFANRSFIIYPNPSLQYEPVHVLNNEPEPVLFQVYNSIGKNVYQRKVDIPSFDIPAGILSKGFYFLVFTRDNGQRQTLKLVVQ